MPWFPPGVHPPGFPGWSQNWQLQRILPALIRPERIVFAHALQHFSLPVLVLLLCVLTAPARPGLRSPLLRGHLHHLLRIGPEGNLWARHLVPILHPLLLLPDQLLLEFFARRHHLLCREQVSLPVTAEGFGEDGLRLSQLLLLQRRLAGR